MYWVEEEEEKPFVVTDTVLDVFFSIRCQALPLDHAYALSMEIRRLLPWFGDEPRAGLHLIHGAESGNGWYRPEDGDDILYLSRRSKLGLRLPKERVEQAMGLAGHTLNVAGHPLELGKAATRPLSAMASIYARHVVIEETADEEAFLALAVAELRTLDLKFKKVLSGRESVVATPEGPMKTRSLLVGGLGSEDSVRLQQVGVGLHRALGCGVFIPHKPV